MIAGARGAAGFLHPEGVYDDAKGGHFRATLYSRLRAHFQFQNKKQLFADVGYTRLFSINASAHNVRRQRSCTWRTCSPRLR